MNIIKLKLVLLLVLLLMPSTVVFAKEEDCTQICPPEAPLCFPNPLQYCTIQDLIERFLNMVFYFGLLIGAVAVWVGAFRLMRHAQNPEMVRKGWKTIWWGVIGMVILFTARGILSIVASLLGLR